MLSGCIRDHRRPTATTTAIATTTAAATTAVATTAAAAGAGRTIFTRARFVNRQRPAIDLFAVERLNGGIGSFLGFHTDKREAARATAEFVLDYINFRDRAVSGEEVLELFLGGVEGKVSDKQFYAHDDYTFRFTALSQPFPTIGSQIITETGSTEDLPGFETGNSSISLHFIGFRRGRNHYFHRRATLLLALVRRLHEGNDLDSFLGFDWRHTRFEELHNGHQ